MSFHEQPFNKRFAVLGDIAEAAYLEIKPLGPTTRFGFRRPDGIKFGSLPEALRHMPDFVTTSHLVEVVGLGRDGVLKSMKVSKYEALKKWDGIAKNLGLLGVAVFIWNSHAQKYIILSWKNIVSEVGFSKRKHGVQKFENDGNEYYRLDWDRLVEQASFVGSHDES